jgi:hypothetical protein
MTILIHGRASPGKTHTAAAMLSGAWSAIAAAFLAVHKAWQARQATISLWNLGPEMLRDIGIEACEIDWVVRHGRADRQAMRLARDPFE